MERSFGGITGIRAKNNKQKKRPNKALLFMSGKSVGRILSGPAVGGTRQSSIWARDYSWARASYFSQAFHDVSRNSWFALAPDKDLAVSPPMLPAGLAKHITSYMFGASALSVLGVSVRTSSLSTDGCYQL